MKRITAALLGSLLSVVTTSAWAEPDGAYPRTAHASEPAERRWYGWQTLIVDGTSLVLMPSLAGHTESVTPLVVGGVGYAAVAPSIHALHGSYGTSAGSLAMRASLPFIGGAVGRSTADCSGGYLDFCPWLEEIIGMWVGAVSAAALDASLLAWEDIENTEGWALGVVPEVSSHTSGARVFASGSF
jgi:hypothetical protein